MIGWLSAGMSVSNFPLSRRLFICGAGPLALVGLAGCGALPPRGGAGGGASALAAGGLAEARTANGLSSLSPDGRLEQAALQQARYMAASGTMSHDTGLGKDFAKRVKANGIEGPAAENIAEGRMDAARAITMWMNSPPHRRNVLDGRFHRFGLAWAASPARPEWRYWAMVLGA